jgi:glycosyltransferase involved in cell wall biosynthesis
MNSVDETILDRTANVAPLVKHGGAFRVAYHGTLSSWYGTDLIIDAIDVLRQQGLEVDAVIVGDGDQVEVLRERLLRDESSQRIHLIGRFVPIELALATVAQASCGVIPNRPMQINRFALPSKLFEYVELEIPVVASHLETLATYFDESEVTFFAPGDVGALARAIRWVHDNPAEARQKATRAKARAEAYSWSHGREVLHRLYASLLSGQH